MEIIERVGAYAGVIAFFGMALLVFLYFSVGRDIRRLREWAGRAPDRPVGVPEKYSDEAAKEAKPKRAKFRFPKQTRYIALLVGGLVVVGAAVSFAVVEITSNDTKSASKEKVKKKKSSAAKVSSVQPSQVTVAVLNGTGTPGLAAAVASSLRAAGFKVGNVTNAAEMDVATTSVMYKKGSNAEAKAVSKQLKVPLRRVSRMDSANRSLAGSADVAVITGEDRVDEAPTAPPASQPPPAAGQGAPNGTAQPQ